ncbi:MAG TPA: type VI secretion system tip protein TssI/VgrG [Acetobacteraceae bacterium]|nr:type VI secretion system tip protein TssI/VgrG [Acetobacteraceae bacterium]
MSGTISRDNAFLSMSTPLGPDVLVPISFQAQEGISEPFLFQIDMVSTELAIAGDALLDKMVCLGVYQRSEAAANRRLFNGIVRSFTATGPAKPGFWGYRAEVVPKLWFMSQTEDCRVFENKSTKDILSLLFQDAGVTDLEWRLQGSATPRVFTMQYNETNLQFATRLMEEEGYFYFFEHTQAKHTLVVGNSNTAFKDIPGCSLVLTANQRAPQFLSAMRPVAPTAYGKVELNDYDPTAPSKALDKSVNTVLTASGVSTRPVFHWPALNYAPADVESRARRRIEAAEAAAMLWEGAGYNPLLYPGGKFTLQKAALSADDGKSFVLRAVVHHAIDQTWAATGGEGSDYGNSFVAFDATQTWRQPVVVPRPKMDGIYAAVVIGPAGEEIYTDDLARVKVKFFWDHRNDTTPDGSVWVRVVQPWAGNGWGAQFLPRIGTEVAVAFLDGDPDRPVVIGGLYNGQMAPIYASADKTKSGLRTRSSLKGGAADFSEFTFDDKKGNELVFLHAQKDYLTEVEHDQTLKVLNCRIKDVTKDETVSIGNNQKVTVSQNRDVEVTKGHDALVVKAGDWSTDVSQGKMTTTVMGNYALTSKTGDIKIDASSGAIKMTAVTSIEMTVGGNSIKISPEGVEIKGMMVKIAAETMLEAKGPMATVKGDGMLTLKGGIIMLN